MIILYQPADGEEQQFDMRRLRASEAQIIERTTDMKWSAIKIGVRDDDPTAMRGVVWAMLKRQQPSLRWSEFDPAVDELTSRFDAREVASYAADIVALPEDRQAGAIAELKAYALDPAGVDDAIAEAADPPKETPTNGTSAADG
ncbi:hypothetical protein OHA91_22755 [Streptomyces erythrochromogenes]|uniref:Uncharacterized protein n=1 Tax=Streptomyces erythrochromogenes TaxID=285574 RepID=A0ABZ1QEI3_9ACTN|nr:hypothetical protein [Streptomyces erythrochromogenes]